MKEQKITTDNRVPERDEILSLYTDAGWTAYTREPDVLTNAVNASMKVYSAWDGRRLIGMARVIGDGFTIVFIQDILVKKNYRRHGIGSRLMNMILSDFSEVRQMSLMTDISPETDAFYRSLGFQAASDKGCRAYIRI